MRALFVGIVYWIKGTFVMLGIFISMVAFATSWMWMPYLAYQGLYHFFYDESYLIYYKAWDLGGGSSFWVRKLNFIEFGAGFVGLVTLIGLFVVQGLDLKGGKRPKESMAVKS